MKTGHPKKMMRLVRQSAPDRFQFLPILQNPGVIPGLERLLHSQQIHRLLMTPRRVGSLPTPSLPLTLTLDRIPGYLVIPPHLPHSQLRPLGEASRRRRG